MNIYQITDLKDNTLYLNRSDCSLVLILMISIITYCIAHNHLCTTELTQEVTMYITGCSSTDHNFKYWLVLKNK